MSDIVKHQMICKASRIYAVRYIHLLRILPTDAIVDETDKRIAGFGTHVSRAGRFVTVGRANLVFDKVSGMLGDGIAPLMRGQVQVRQI
jgi:hypothetical protein